MISRELLKAEIDKVKSEHLELPCAVIRLLEDGGQAAEASAATAIDWHEFVANTYGGLSDAPIVRGERGQHDSREAVD